MIAISFTVIATIIGVLEVPFEFPQFVRSSHPKPAFLWSSLELANGPIGHALLAAYCLSLLLRFKVREWYEIAGAACLLGFVCGEYLHWIMIGRS